MTLDKPIWIDYLVWDNSDPLYPVVKGFKKDTPKEIIEQYKKDQRMYAKAEEEGDAL